MNSMDIRTTLAIQVAMYAICGLVVSMLWFQNHRRFAGLSLWMASFALQIVGNGLIALRGRIPDWESVVLANVLAVAGALLLNLGLERFVRRPGRQAHNVVLLGLFAVVHWHFTFAQPSLTARFVNTSAALLVTSLQGIWILAHRAAPRLQRAAAPTVAVLAAFGVLSIVRIVDAAYLPEPGNDYMNAGGLQAVVLILYQMLWVLLTFSLAMLVNGRLLDEVRVGEEKYAKAFHSSPYAILLTRLADDRVIEVNHGFEALSGYAASEVVGRTTEELLLWNRSEDQTEIANTIRTGDSVRDQECTFRTKSGETRIGLLSVDIIEHDGEPLLLSTVNDITVRAQAAAERAVLEAQLQHARELESVGRLAGGVAHEFNNMMGVILGNTEFALRQVEPALPLHADLLDIQQAAQRAANITGQLLAYSRRQAVQPIALDLNAAVSGQLAMLQRLIGQAIGLVWVPGATLSPITKDPSQLTTLLTNLCLNARDAIEGTGTITLRTANCAIDAAACDGHTDAVPGDYVQLTVHDTGRGMDATTLERAFEPFFTTKDFGESSGLGLASVYGAVKQAGGFITVASVPGQGTTFALHWPRRTAEDLAGEPEPTAEAPR